MPQPVDRFIHNQRLGRGVNIVGYDPIWKSRPQARIQARAFSQEELEKIEAILK
jgi:hypothetical protein